jgi:hypothetical protein
MRDLVERLHRARLNLASVDRLYDAAKQQFESEYALLRESREKAQSQVDEATMAVRTAGIIAFRETGDLAPAPGIKIVMRNRLDYDPEEAKRWAMTHKMALTLDAREFEKLAKAAPANFDFVRIYQEPGANIATDLGPVLDEVKE